MIRCCLPFHPFSEDLREAGMWLDTEFQSWQASRFLTRIGYKVGRGNQFEQNGITVIFFLIFFFFTLSDNSANKDTCTHKKSRWLINRGLTRLCRLVCTMMVESRYCHLQVSHCVTNHGGLCADPSTQWRLSLVTTLTCYLNNHKMFTSWFLVLPMPQRSSCAPKTRTSLSSSGESHAVTEGSRSKDIGSVCNRRFLKVERGNVCGFVCLRPYDGTCMLVWMNICMNIYSTTSRKISHRSLGLLHFFYIW